MPVLLSLKAKEQSTYVVTADFTDEDDSAVIPNNIAWTLTDEGGTVINEREDEAIGSPAASVDIVLQGADLALQTGESGSAKRIITIKADYDSSLGSGLPLNESAIFTVVDLTAVT